MLWGKKYILNWYIVYFKQTHWWTWFFIGINMNVSSVSKHHHGYFTFFFRLFPRNVTLSQPHNAETRFLVDIKFEHRPYEHLNGEMYVSGADVVVLYNRMTLVAVGLVFNASCGAYASVTKKRAMHDLSKCRRSLLYHVPLVCVFFLSCLNFLKKRCY